MPQFTFVAPDKADWRDNADSRIKGGGEAVVRPLVRRRCNLDVGFVPIKASMKSEEPIGHEMIAEIVGGPGAFRPDAIDTTHHGFDAASDAWPDDAAIRTTAACGEVRA